MSGKAQRWLTKKGCSDILFIFLFCVHWSMNIFCSSWPWLHYFPGCIYVPGWWSGYWFFWPENKLVDTWYCSGLLTNWRALEIFDLLKLVDIWFIYNTLNSSIQWVGSNDRYVICHCIPQATGAAATLENSWPHKHIDVPQMVRRCASGVWGSVIY